MKQLGHWNFYPRNFEPDIAVGFIYMIVDKDTHEKYIGRKWFRGRGKFNKGVESAWRQYTSSSTEINRRIMEKSKDRFDFIIIEQYSTIGGLAFAEVWSQVFCETPSNNSEFMNRLIDKISWKVTEPVTDRHKRRLAQYRKKYPFPKET
jgi:hypothetical protein